MNRLLASCPYLTGVLCEHGHHAHMINSGPIHGGKSTGLGVIGAIFLFLLVRGLITGKWG